MTEQDVATAVLAAINAQFSTVRAYELTDPAVKALTTDHVLVVTARRFVPDRLASGEVTVPGGRVVTRYVAKTAGNVRNLRAKTAAALEDRILGGIGPFVFESEDAPDMDGGWVVATDTWTH